MAAVRDTTAKNIKPLTGAVIRRFTAGAAVVAGEIVAMQSDGKVDPANTTAAAVVATGIVLDESAGDGDNVDVVVFGPVQCVTGATIGAIIHATDTAGEPGETAGTNAGKVGWAESATTVFVNPQF